MTRRPTLVVGLTEPAPITETTPTTSGSALMASAASAWRVCISVNDTSGPASVTAVIEAVSCKRQKALWRDDVEDEGRGQGGERHEQRGALALQHPQQRPVIELDGASR